MDEQRLKAMLAEYAVLCSTFDKHLTVGYSVIPAALTAVGGFVILAQPGAYNGLAAAAIILVVVAWMGVSHGLLSMYGLRLVEIEVELDGSLPGLPPQRAAFFTRAIGRGFPILLPYLSAFFLVGSAAMFLALSEWWQTMTKLAWLPAFKVLGVLAPVLATVLVLGNIYWVERKTQRRMSRILARDSTSSA